MAKNKVGGTPQTKQNGTDSSVFRPVALLCHMYKLIKKIVLNIVGISVDD